MEWVPLLPEPIYLKLLLDKSVVNSHENETGVVNRRKLFVEIPSHIQTVGQATEYIKQICRLRCNISLYLQGYRVPPYLDVNILRKPGEVIARSATHPMTASTQDMDLEKMNLSETFSSLFPPSMIFEETGVHSLSLGCNTIEIDHEMRSDTTSAFINIIHETSLNANRMHQDVMVEAQEEEVASRWYDLRSSMINDYNSGNKEAEKPNTIKFEDNLTTFADLSSIERSNMVGDDVGRKNAVSHTKPNLISTSRKIKTKYQGKTEPFSISPAPANELNTNCSTSSVDNFRKDEQTNDVGRDNGIYRAKKTFEGNIRMAAKESEESSENIKNNFQCLEEGRELFPNVIKHQEIFKSFTAESGYDSNSSHTVSIDANEINDERMLRKEISEMSESESPHTENIALVAKKEKGSIEKVEENTQNIGIAEKIFECVIENDKIHVSSDKLEIQNKTESSSYPLRLEADSSRRSITASSAPVFASSSSGDSEMFANCSKYSPCDTEMLGIEFPMLKFAENISTSANNMNINSGESNERLLDENIASSLAIIKNTHKSDFLCLQEGRESFPNVIERLENSELFSAECEHKSNDSQNLSIISNEITDERMLQKVESKRTQMEVIGSVANEKKGSTAEVKENIEISEVSLSEKAFESKFKNDKTSVFPDELDIQKTASISSSLTTDLGLEADYSETVSSAAVSGSSSGDSEMSANRSKLSSGKTETFDIALPLSKLAENISAPENKVNTPNNDKSNEVLLSDELVVSTPHIKDDSQSPGSQVELLDTPLTDRRCRKRIKDLRKSTVPNGSVIEFKHRSLKTSRVRRRSDSQLYRTTIRVQEIQMTYLFGFVLFQDGHTFDEEFLKTKYYFCKADIHDPFIVTSKKSGVHLPDAGLLLR